MPFVDESKVTEWTNRLKSYFALLTHKHDASDITSGTLTVSQGGTGGTTALDARKNLSVPVDSSIAYVESTTATKNHAVGDYFMLGSVLMKATSAIATGEQITTSKATPVTVQSQIDTLRDSVSSLLVTEQLGTTVTLNDTDATQWVVESHKVGYTPVTFSWGHNFSTRVITAWESVRLDSEYFYLSGYGRLYEGSPLNVSYGATVLWRKNGV